MPRFDHDAGRARLDEIVTAERRVELTVEAIEEYAQRIREFEDSLPSRGTKQPIESGLGIVVVDGTGRLRDVRLDVRRVSAAEADALGKKILRSIKHAEARVKSFRSDQLKKLSDACRMSE